MSAPSIELIGFSKRFGALAALDDVSVKIESGAFHALLGENGAGKSTLMKIIYGAVQPDAGRIEWQGRAVTIASPAQARAQVIRVQHGAFAHACDPVAAESRHVGERAHQHPEIAVKRL